MSIQKARDRRFKIDWNGFQPGLTLNSTLDSFDYFVFVFCFCHTFLYTMLNCLALHKSIALTNV